MGAPETILASLDPKGSLHRRTIYLRIPSCDVIRHQGYLIVGVDQNTKLLGYYNPNTKQFEGFDIDIASEIAKAIFGATFATIFIIARF